jgi:hypothetical protein
MLPDMEKTSKCMYKVRTQLVWRRAQWTKFGDYMCDIESTRIDSITGHFEMSKDIDWILASLSFCQSLVSVSLLQGKYSLPFEETKQAYDFKDAVL